MGLSPEAYFICVYKRVRVASDRCGGLENENESTAEIFEASDLDFWIWELEFWYWPWSTGTRGQVPERGLEYRYPVHFPQLLALGLGILLRGTGTRVRVPVPNL